MVYNYNYIYNKLYYIYIIIIIYYNYNYGYILIMHTPITFSYVIYKSLFRSSSNAKYFVAICLLVVSQTIYKFWVGQ